MSAPEFFAPAGNVLVGSASISLVMSNNQSIVFRLNDGKEFSVDYPDNGAADAAYAAIAGALLEATGAPTVSTMAPQHGQADISIAIIGTNLAAALVGVTINGINCIAIVPYIPNDSVCVGVPPTLVVGGPYDVVLTTAYGSVTAGTFTLDA